MKINILESEWTIEYCNADADPQLEGGRSRKENEQIREKMKNVPTWYPHCLAGERGTVFRKASQGFCCY